MIRNYIAYCKCGKIVAIATAHTIKEIADHSKDAREWEKLGFRTELVEAPDDTPMPEWCPNNGNCEKNKQEPDTCRK